MSDAEAAFRIKPGTEKDVPAILRLIKGLAEYEELSSEVVATEADLRESLFGDRPAAEVVLGYRGSEPIGFALFFTSYSTFLGRAGIYLEDLFVVPEWRKHGYGRQLLTHVAGIAVRRGCGRMEWSVLNWNRPAIDFYESLGARPMDEWTMYRLTGEALERVGGDGD